MEPEAGIAELACIPLDPEGKETLPGGADTGITSEPEPMPDRN